MPVSEFAPMTNQCNVVRDQRCDFAVSYELSRLPALRELERNVLGCDYGGTSWTTRAQADHIAESLDLRPGVQLLDIPLNALKQAAERAVDNRISKQIRVVAGSGNAVRIRLP